MAGAVAAAPPDDGSINSELAEAQFRVYLLTHTDLRPTDISCSRPPTQDVAGEMLCFALVDGRQTVAALATLESPGVYSFTAISKSDAPAGTSAQTPASTDPAPPTLPTVPGDPPVAPTVPTDGGEEPAGSADEAILAALEQATTGESAETTEVLVSYLPELQSVESYSFDAPTSTLQVRATSSTTDPARRSEMAWSITDTMAYLWEATTPLRDPGATIRPRLEVILDDEIYGTPYDVMVRVADYDIDFDEWLSITTGTNAYGAGDTVDNGRDRNDRSPDRALDVEHRAPATTTMHVESRRRLVTNPVGDARTLLA